MIKFHMDSNKTVDWKEGNKKDYEKIIGAFDDKNEIQYINIKDNFFININKIEVMVLEEEK